MIHPYKKSASEIELFELKADSYELAVPPLTQYAQRGGFKGGRLLGEMELLQLYVYAQPLANAIDIVPQAATKKIPKIKITSKNPDTPADLVAIASDLMQWALPVIREAIHFARLYGWSIIPIFTTETTDYSRQPQYKESFGWITDLRAVAGGACQDATVLEYHSEYYTRNYGRPLKYNIAPYLDTIHADRCILITGIKDQRPLKGGIYRIGYSLLEPLVRAWDEYEVAMGSLLKILDSKSIEVFMVPNLKEILLNPRKLQSFLTGLKACKKAIGGYLIDSAGSYAHVDRSLTGVNDAMSQFLQKISMQANLPDTILFGISPAGLTSGSYETSVLDNLTATYQQTELEPIYRQLLDTFFSMMGLGCTQYELSFSSPSVESKAELAQVERDKADGLNKLASALQMMVGEGFMKPEVAASVFAHAIDGVNPNVEMSAIDKGDKSLLGEKEEPKKENPNPPKVDEPE
jgi:phage-related protein (TIGR01555 family)